MTSSEILSKALTSYRQIEKEIANQAVALPIVNKLGQILLLRERHDDLDNGRSAGQWNILTETWDYLKDGSSIRGNVRRGVWEELGIETENFKVNFRILDNSYRETNEVYLEKVHNGFKFRSVILVYQGECFEDPNRVFHSPTNEIAEYMWVDFDDIDQLDLEDGAKRVLDYYHGQNLI